MANFVDTFFRSFFNFLRKSSQKYKIRISNIHSVKFKLEKNTGKRLSVNALETAHVESLCKKASGTSLCDIVAWKTACLLAHKNNPCKIVQKCTEKDPQKNAPQNPLQNSAYRKLLEHSTGHKPFRTFAQKSSCDYAIKKRKAQKEREKSKKLIGIDRIFECLKTWRKWRSVKSYWSKWKIQRKQIRLNGWSF